MLDFDMPVHRSTCDMCLDLVGVGDFAQPHISLIHLAMFSFRAMLSWTQGCCSISRGVGRVAASMRRL